MDYIYVTKAQALAMHEFLVNKFGGSHGVRDHGLLESALAQPRQSAFGKDIYPDIFLKASAYAFSLSENQPFVDGNKRVAASVMGAFLIANGYEPTCSQIDLYNTIMKLANRKLSRESLAKWLRKNAKCIRK